MIQAMHMSRCGPERAANKQARTGEPHEEHGVVWGGGRQGSGDAGGSNSGRRRCRLIPIDDLYKTIAAWEVLGAARAGQDREDREERGLRRLLSGCLIRDHLCALRDLRPRRGDIQPLAALGGTLDRPPPCCVPECLTCLSVTTQLPQSATFASCRRVRRSPPVTTRSTLPPSAQGQKETRIQCAIT